MMPKGVEHAARQTPPGYSRPVKIPMMPKGVEHKVKEAGGDNLPLVKIPMMPKGVEHIFMPPRHGKSELCEDSNDAERR